MQTPRLPHLFTAAELEAMASSTDGTPGLTDNAVVADLLYTARIQAAELAKHEKDLEDAAGAFPIALPAPGSVEAKLLRANCILKGERTAWERERHSLRELVRVALRELDAVCREANPRAYSQGDGIHPMQGKVGGMDGVVQGQSLLAVYSVCRRLYLLGVEKAKAAGIEGV